MIVAWRSSETSPSLASSRYVRRAAGRRDLAVVDELANESLELRRVRRVLVGADDDDVGDGRRRIRREHREPSLVCALRFGIVGRSAFGREAEEGRDRENRKHDHGNPGAYRSPWMACAGRGEGPGREHHESIPITMRLAPPWRSHKGFVAPRKVVLVTTSLAITSTLALRRSAPHRPTGASCAPTPAGDGPAKQAARRG